MPASRPAATPVPTKKDEDDEEEETETSSEEETESSSEEEPEPPPKKETKVQPSFISRLSEKVSQFMGVKCMEVDLFCPSESYRIKGLRRE